MSADPQALLCNLEPEEERQVFRTRLRQLFDEFRRSPITGRARDSTGVSRIAFSDAPDLLPLTFSGRTDLVKNVTVLLRIERIARQYCHHPSFGNRCGRAR